VGCDECGSRGSSGGGCGGAGAGLYVIICGLAAGPDLYANVVFTAARRRAQAEIDFVATSQAVQYLR